MFGSVKVRISQWLEVQVICEHSSSSLACFNTDAPPPCGVSCSLQGGNGVIPAHRSKAVEFAFCPSLAGTFAESLSVTNVLDESNTQVTRRTYGIAAFFVVHRLRIALEPGAPDWCAQVTTVEARLCGIVLITFLFPCPASRVTRSHTWSAACSALPSAEGNNGQICIFFFSFFLDPPGDPGKKSLSSIHFLFVNSFGLVGVVCQVTCAVVNLSGEGCQAECSTLKAVWLS